MYNKLAKVALDMIKEVAVKASDEDLALALQTRQMLNSIASGRLIVTAPPQDATDKKQTDVSDLLGGGTPAGKPGKSRRLAAVPSPPSEGNEQS